MTQRNRNMSQLEAETKHFWRLSQMSSRHSPLGCVGDETADELDLLSRMTSSPRIRRLSEQAVAQRARRSA